MIPEIRNRREQGLRTILLRFSKLEKNRREQGVRTL